MSVRFRVLTAVSMKMTVFLDVVWCSPVEVYIVSEVLTATIIRVIRVTHHLHCGNSKHL
jgi:hypothetical protein